jgi:hypothetical protein
LLTIDLEDVREELAANGFAVRDGTLADVRLASIISHGWTAAPQKAGALVSRLRPMDMTQAPPRTLSAVHGLEAQPLHTDGAHLQRLPDIIVLHAPQPAATPTVVWKLPDSVPSCLHSGVFTVRGNETSFLAHAYADRRLRFDPVCMSPADHLARDAIAYLRSVRSDAYKHQWERGGTLLFIDNRRSLHAREAVLNAGDAETRVIERAAYVLERQ